MAFAYMLVPTPPTVSPSCLVELAMWLVAKIPPAPGMYFCIIVGFPGKCFQRYLFTVLIRQFPLPRDCLLRITVSILPL